ncbi:UNVERIFIED_CONTAM: hypothetical protein PYX00_000097 [Menopon gallinae]|uniref:Oxysterol-binding protein n=1 Tax=Menopon gallinae TaxID=328185 RepID=A0AAW2I9U8_9NEOP
MTRPTLEGSLTKWTNVMKGWQHRWFVLDENAGLLSYYTSREKMMRGVRRGCVRLKGAILGIDNEEDGNFTITTDAKTFHFQARNATEREVWLRALEDTILMHADFPHEHQFQPIVVLRKHMPHHLLKVHFDGDESSYETNMKKFDNRIAQADALLQMLIEQTQALEARVATVEDELLKARLERITKNYNLMLDSVKLAIVFLQILKNTIDPENGIGLVTSNFKSRKPTKSLGSQFHIGKRSSSDALSLQPQTSCNSDASAGEDQATGDARPQPLELEVASDCLEVPETSYSSSDEDDFYDADEDIATPTCQNAQKFITIGNSVTEANTSQKTANEAGSSKRVLRPSQPPPVRTDGTLDYDALYEDDNESDISMENHGSVITHLLSQVKIGMDLTKVVLPTFILESRSLLEMYADYFAHPDMFVGIVDKKTPKDRLIQVVKWYMSAYHAGRKTGVAKKPYNPILGEIFQCYWDVPGIQHKDGPELKNGPVPWCNQNQLTFVAEQVSHHPPISAFYAECVLKRICFQGFVYTKSKFLGLSVGVHNIGHGTIYLIDTGEEYVVTFPSGYGRSILTTPWIELGGSVTVTCKKTGYFANIEFHTKPFYGGKKHRVSGELFSPNDKKPFLTISGEWNGLMEAKWTDNGKTEVFVNVLVTPVTRKSVRKISEQEENESRKLWRDVTAGLKMNDIDKATNAKTNLEQKQRDDAKKRKERGIQWVTKLFYEDNQGDWCYKKPLYERESLSSVN